MMAFSSAVFLFIFLPVVWIIHTVVPEKYIRARNVILAVSSILFYAYGEPIYILLLISSVVINYSAAVSISKSIGEQNEKKRKRLTAAAAVFNIGVLLFFKYVPHICSLAVKTFSPGLPVFTLSMPVGISFYSLQMLSYVLDVSRGRSEAEKDVLSLMLYVSFFPQLITGPVVRYETVKPQLLDRRITVNDTAEGIKRFIFGLSKKLLVADTAAVIADAAFSSKVPSAAMAWAGVLCCCIQIYFGFSGYSDMAIGLARVFGFRLDENFNYPYIACSVRDFWKRWHISLTSWFNDYVYVPLKGKHASSARTVISVFTVFLLMGMWHGEKITCLLWGLWQGILVSLEFLIGAERLEKKKYLRPLMHIYTLFCISLGFAVLRSGSVISAVSYIRSMFAFGGSAADVLRMFNGYNVLMLAAGAVLCAPLLPFIREKLGGKAKSAFNGFEYILSIALFALCIMTVSTGEAAQFVYIGF